MSVKFKETIQTQTQTDARGGGGFGYGGYSRGGQDFRGGGAAFGSDYMRAGDSRGGPGFGGAAAGLAGAGAGFGAGAAGFRGGDMRGDGYQGRHPLRHELGEALTRGAGPGGYLAAYLKQLQHYPLRTKMLTSGSLAGLQEFLASWIAKDRGPGGYYFTSRVPKMMIYGAFVSAPMGHMLVKFLQFIFANRTSLRAKVMQILVSNLIVSPIQNSIYLVSMAIIAGARTFHQIRATVRAGFWPVMRVSWITSPIALAFAQQFLPPETWVPFFNFIAFVIGTYINSITKKKRLAALRRKYSEEGRDSRETRDSREERDYRDYRD